MAPFLPFLSAAALPETAKILKTLTTSEFFFPIALLIGGILILLFGFKAHRWVVVVNCVALGYWVGNTLGAHAQIATVGAIIGAALLGVVCWPLMKYAVAVCGGLVGATLGMTAWTYFQYPPDLRWAGGLAGLILLGMLSFVVFKASVILFSCIQGAAMMVLGVSALLMRYTPWQGEIYANLTGKPILMPILVSSVALLGIIYQQKKYGFLDHAGAHPKPAPKPEAK